MTFQLLSEVTARHPAQRKPQDWREIWESVSACRWQLEPQRTPVVQEEYVHYGEKVRTRDRITISAQREKLMKKTEGDDQRHRRNWYFRSKNIKDSFKRKASPQCQIPHESSVVRTMGAHWLSQLGGYLGLGVR